MSVYMSCASVCVCVHARMMAKALLKGFLLIAAKYTYIKFTISSVEFTGVRYIQIVVRELSRTLFILQN